MRITGRQNASFWTFSLSSKTRGRWLVILLVFLILEHLAGGHVVVLSEEMADEPVVVKELESASGQTPPHSEGEKVCRLGEQETATTEVDGVSSRISRRDTADSSEVDPRTHQNMKNNDADLPHVVPPQVLPAQSSSSSIRRRVPSSCQLVMAPLRRSTTTWPDDPSTSTTSTPWGVFTLMDRKKGRPVLWGDVVIQLTDIDLKPYIRPEKGSASADGWYALLRHFAWTADETGGFYEGHTVVSVVPGLGMLAQGRRVVSSTAALSEEVLPKILPFVPSYDEGGLTRNQSPGAGALTHYHNYTFFTQQAVRVGQELWYRLDGRRRWWWSWHPWPDDDGTSGTSFLPLAADQAFHEVEWLREHGQCLDHMRPGPSTNPEAGRGALATRSIPQGTVVAPVPVVPIFSPDRLAGTRRVKLSNGTSKVIHTQQLLLNYCLGHAQSSWLFFPYAPLVNLINHAPGAQANVRLQWSTSPALSHPHSTQWRQQPLPPLSRENDPPRPLLLELVALRDVERGEEILMDYGPDWTAAWARHVQQWSPPEHAEIYTPSYVHQDTITSLRIEAELRNHPYPEEIFTSCFYRYADHKAEAEKSNPIGSTESGVTTFRWQASRGIYELRYLRPCTVLQRQHDRQAGTTFTVQIKNRPGLAPEEAIPARALHIVTDVPRRAIRFSDHLYSTDQHLEKAFRHPIGIPDDIFPEAWKDLSEPTSSHSDHR